MSRVHRLRTTDRIFFVTVNLRRALAAGEIADAAAQTVAVDIAAIKSLIETKNEVRSGGCAAAFPLF